MKLSIHEKPGMIQVLNDRKSVVCEYFFNDPEYASNAVIRIQQMVQAFNQLPEDQKKKSPFLKKNIE